MAEAMSRPVLLVEDDAGELTLLREAFEECRIERTLVTAQTGDEALAVLHGDDTACEPALIVLDLNLPGLSGHELLRRIRNHASTQLTPVVVLSGSDAPTDIARSYEARANAYVTKPETYRDMVELVRAIDRFWLARRP
jgi:chemotaxis family two-component system response regulator Rcp1